MIECTRPRLGNLSPQWDLLTHERNVQRSLMFVIHLHVNVWPLAVPVCSVRHDVVIAKPRKPRHHNTSACNAASDFHETPTSLTRPLNSPMPMRLRPRLRVVKEAGFRLGPCSYSSQVVLMHISSNNHDTTNPLGVLRPHQCIYTCIHWAILVYVRRVCVGFMRRGV